MINLYRGVEYVPGTYKNTSNADAASCSACGDNSKKEPSIFLKLSKLQERELAAAIDGKQDLLCGLSLGFWKTATPAAIAKRVLKKDLQLALAAKNIQFSQKMVEVQLVKLIKPLI
jgi:hypothetical protein